MNTQSLATLMNVKNNELLKQTEIKITDTDVTIRISNESLERDMTDDDCLYIITYMEINKQEIESKLPNKNIDWGFATDNEHPCQLNQILSNIQLNEIEGHVESQIELLYCSLAEDFDLPYGNVTPHHTLKMNELKENLKILMDEYVSTNLPTNN